MMMGGDLNGPQPWAEPSLPASTSWAMLYSGYWIQPAYKCFWKGRKCQASRELLVHEVSHMQFGTWEVREKSSIAPDQSPHRPQGIVLCPFLYILSNWLQVHRTLLPSLEVLWQHSHSWLCILGEWAGIQGPPVQERTKLPATAVENEVQGYCWNLFMTLC